MSVTFPAAQILLQAGFWEKFCEISMINMAMASRSSQQRQAMSSSARPGSLPALASCSNQPGDTEPFLLGCWEWSIHRAIIPGGRV